MRFGQLFEYHKIPEWYNNYLKYEKLKEGIEKFQEQCNNGERLKLHGLYMYLGFGKQIIRL